MEEIISINDHLYTTVVFRTLPANGFSRQRARCRRERLFPTEQELPHSAIMKNGDLRTALCVFSSLEQTVYNRLWVSEGH